jgi:glucosamine-6-phosphate deaminase
VNTTQRERIPTCARRHGDIAHVVASRIAALIRQKDAAGAARGPQLATGSTPIGVYREVDPMHREEGLSFKNVDVQSRRYYPMAPDNIHSYRWGTC